jgi:hypothetical protein
MQFAELTFVRHSAIGASAGKRRYIPAQARAAYDVRPKLLKLASWEFS